MNEAGVLANLLAWTLQCALVVAAAAVLSRLARIDLPGVRYGLWRFVLLVCLVLPLAARALPPAAAGAAEAAAGDGGVLTTVSGFRLVADPAADGPSATAMLVLGALVTGTVVRLLWLALSIVRLRRLRVAGSRADDAACDELQRQLGTAADVRRVAGATQPVTFGVRRPVVLLPDALSARSPGIQRAVLAHELLHVRRRDWAWFVAEEVVRAVLWFNVPVWWLLSRIQLAREELIDHLTVVATGSRRTYLDALIGFADAPPAPTAAAFARRSQLFRRMVLLSREVTMPVSRVVVSSAFTIMVVVGGSWYAMAAFPLRAQVTSAGAVAGNPQADTAAHAVTPENPIPRRLRGVAAAYPEVLRGSRISGAVELQVTIDATGAVARTRVAASAVAAGGGTLPGSDARGVFLTAASEAVQQWLYEPPVEAPLAFYVAFTFQADREAAVSQSASPQGVVAFNGQARTGRPGDLIARGADNGGRTGGAAVAPPSNTSPAIRVGGRIRPPVKVKDVGAEYPAAALAAGVEGVVIPEVRIDGQGRVADARILRSIPLLDQAALDAVRQWEFTPTMLNGAPVDVRMIVTVQFTRR